MNTKKTLLFFLSISLLVLTKINAQENDFVYDSFYLAGDMQWINAWTGAECKSDSKTVGISLEGMDSDKKGDIFYGISPGAPLLKGILIQTPKDEIGKCVLSYASDSGGTRYMGIVRFKNELLGMPTLLFKGKVPPHLEFGNIFAGDDPTTAKAGELIRADVQKKMQAEFPCPEGEQEETCFAYATGTLQRIVIPERPDLLLNAFNNGSGATKTFGYSLEPGGPIFVWEDRNHISVSLVMRADLKAEWVLLEKSVSKATSAEELIAIDSKMQRRTVKGFLYGGC